MTHLTRLIEKHTDLAKAEGVARSENLPFLIEATKPTDLAALLIHGFGSSPREMRPLALALAAKGMTVYAVRLPGHGTSPEDLASCRVEDWLSTCVEACSELIDNGYAVTTAGLSTGALLCLKLALKLPVERQILLSPFLKLQHPLAAAAGILRFIIPYQHKEISAEEQPFYYQKRPLKGIAQINRLRWQLAHEIHAIDIPTLVLASKGDQTIAEGTAEKLFKRIASQEKELHLYGTDVPHVLTSKDNPEQKDVLKRCVDFMTSEAASRLK